MKPEIEKRLRELLADYSENCVPGFYAENERLREKAIQAIAALVREELPEEKYLNPYSLHEGGFNDCRDQILKDWSAE